MDGSANSILQVYDKQVGLKFQLYNSLFTALPFHRVERTGVLLSIFLLHCEEGYAKKQSPAEIIDSFIKQYTSYTTEQEKMDLLFRFVQYAERQVVLFDALEDAAYRDINDMQGPGTLKHLQSEVVQTQSQEQLAEKLKDFSVRLVLTAHPTQFYPAEVLGIINDLSKALLKDNVTQINSYLRQLGKTPFFRNEKPTPYDEAVNLIWYLENVFYHAAGQILSYLKTQFPEEVSPENPVIRFGFWPGGDRDGNPFVNAKTTIKVAEALRGGALKSYYLDVRKLRRRLTFKGVANVVVELERKLYNNIFVPGHGLDITKEEILSTLQQMRQTLIEQHNGLFQNLVENLLRKVELFGLFFASLDIRQDSSAHAELLETIVETTSALPKDFLELSEADKIKALVQVSEVLDPALFDNELHRDTLESMAAIREIQRTNGEEGCNRYIISHSTSALDVMQVYGLFLMSGWQKENLTVDIVPLFETVDDLRNARGVMQSLYENETYRQHLLQRGNIQTIMLGFSDGTKDGGYLMANWSIYKAKEELTAISRQYDIEVIFFDGRGGPPARGGGRTHQFYASMGPNISNKEIQLTIQGQTISSNFGTEDAAKYNIEQLMHAGIRNTLFATKDAAPTSQQEELMQQLSNESFEKYTALKNHPNFLEYLNNVSPLRYYGEANIGSRPSKRKPGKLNLNDLRAVPYVGSWSQLKQNLPGYYGVGTALQRLDEAGKWEEIRQLYKNSLFFKTLMDNCEMAMTKSFFPLTAFLAEHPNYAELWNMIHDEFELSKSYMLKLTGAEELMADKPVNRLSIQMRQRIELPLLTVQQYGLIKLREMEEKNQPTDNKSKYEKLVVRCSFGIINAERNSA
ncbi:phosphoenolpyruvate carboxylase type 1 [Pontibacter ummariensis]|uniref:Phosphoenolpyruvate carboxylase n=1 Tax=Pontibacter ummariensis TaxID=1610492 RepID=A0A239KZV8_9BACT|nr:phosphoenolpyruvate carboxylase [Pontibacter ummariensis]PRY04664.1 phosphoenolpyruvate carboxylase type 1 [Pontibacter ummariensis]SNT23123.1 Phosphoenolpyruvate carboxylase, type 1 [Pontibacter ummariensis]